MSRVPLLGCVNDIVGDDALAESENGRILRVDCNFNPVDIGRAEGFDAGEVFKPATVFRIHERLVDPEVVA